jgi:septum formation protein
MNLILASTSRYRQELLGRLGLPFRCVAPGVDEDAFKAEGRPPRELAELLALEKAMAVARAEPGATVIGGDQLVAFKGRVLGKPGSREGAVEQLLELSGEAHELITAVAVVHEGRVAAHTDVARMHVRALGRAEVERYVDADEPFDCAGSYKLEARGIALFERIVAADHSAITGLPLIALTSILRGLGAAVP